MTSTDITGEHEPRYVRLHIELVAEITDEAALKAAALKQVQHDEFMDDDERAQAVEAIELDPSGSLAHFVDPLQLIGEVPGIELAQATWESSHTEFDPENDEWDVYDNEDGPAED